MTNACLEVPDVPELVDRIIRAHGGIERWQAVETVMARVSMGGLEFTSRLHPAPLRDVEVCVTAGTPVLSMAGYPAEGQVAHFQPSRVWIERADGHIEEERAAPGATFRTLRHWFLWDRLDIVYYCGVTLWQALCLPFSLLRSGCELTELAPEDMARGERLYPLRVVYPADVPCFASEQTYYADAAGLLHRVDSSPQLYGTWLRVSQLLEGHEMFEGFVHATRRHVHPCSLGGHPLRSVPLSWMHLDDISVVRRSVS